MVQGPVDETGDASSETGEEPSSSDETGVPSDEAGDSGDFTTSSASSDTLGTSSGSSDTTAADTETTGTTSGSPGDAGDTGSPSDSDTEDADSTGESGSNTDGGVSTTGDGPTLPPLDPLSDEFDDPVASAERWLVRDVVEGTPPQYTVFDFGESHPGALTIRPTAGGWFANYDGPYVYTHITGNFMVETEVSATTLDPERPGDAPKQPYSSAGLLLRDPNHTPTSENWITHNLGRQDGFDDVNVGTEGKRTRNSTSRLVIVPGPNRGRLRMCRVDGIVWLTRRLEGETEFQLTHVYGLPPDPWGPFDMDEVQVGLSTSGWNSLGNHPNLELEPDIEAVWSYIRIWRIGDLQACLVND